MKKILVISWFYPPINSSEGLVTYKLLRNSKLQYDICMQANTASWSYGIDDQFPESDNVHKIYSKSKTLDKWVDEITEFFKEHMDEYDVVMTRSMPPESHKIGLNIKAIKPQITWIASFGDPIANNPFNLKMLYAIPPYSIKNRYIRPMGLKEILSLKRVLKHLRWLKQDKKARIPLEKDKVLEKSILEHCDYTIYNSTEQCEYMTSACSEKIKKKAVVIPHSFDEELYQPKKEKPHNKVRIVYVGHLDDIRTPRPFLEAINLLNEEMDDLEDRLEVKFYGNMSKNEKIYIMDNDLLDIVRIKKPVTYLESLKIMQNADWLLHIDADLSSVLDHNIFFAAKLADYIGSSTPIMGITMTEGPSAQILRDLNTLIMSYSVEEIKNYLYLILYCGYKVELNTQESNKFNAKTVAKTFDSFVEEKILSKN